MVVNKPLNLPTTPLYIHRVARYKLPRRDIVQYFCLEEWELPPLLFNPPLFLGYPIFEMNCVKTPK